MVKRGTMAPSLEWNYAYNLSRARCGLSETGIPGGHCLYRCCLPRGKPLPMRWGPPRMCAMGRVRDADMGRGGRGGEKKFEESGQVRVRKVPQKA